MKKTIISFRTVFFATIFFLSAGVANATEIPSDKVASLTFHYVGKVENFPVFQLDLSNVEADELLVVVKDIYNEILFTETLTGKFITRRYGINVDAADLDKIQVVVTNKKTKTTKLYQINSSNVTVQNVTVAQL